MPNLLFIAQPEIAGPTLIFRDPDLLHQRRSVLRLRSGTTLTIQQETLTNLQFFSATLESLTRDEARARIEQQRSTPKFPTDLHIFQALPNRRDKAELLAQKLTELGCKNLTFFPADRSVLKKSNPAKFERLTKIAREACEQSRSGQLLALSISSKNFSQLFTEFSGQKFVLDHRASQNLKTFSPKNSENFSHEISGPRAVFIGPEGGRSDAERATIPSEFAFSLGKTILRTETAPILAARFLGPHPDEIPDFTP